MNRSPIAIAAATAAFVATGPALAHHPLGGAPMETMAEGILSGIGHPLLGFDHLFFVVAVGIAAIHAGRALSAPAGYLLGMLGGVALVLTGIALPAVEAVIALSLFAIGALLMAGRALPGSVALGLFALLGLFHGWAFGGALAGQEGGAATLVIAGYMIGLAATQYAIAIGAGALLRRAAGIDPAALMPRLSGAMVAGAGLFLVLEHAEAAALVALGWG